MMSGLPEPRSSEFSLEVFSDIFQGGKGENPLRVLQACDYTLQDAIHELSRVADFLSDEEFAKAVRDLNWAALLWEIEQYGSVRSNLRRASLFDADLSGLNLSNVDLRDAKLHGTIFRNTNLSGALLSNATLRNADLTGAILDGANLDGADLRGATFDNRRISNINLLAVEEPITDRSGNFRLALEHAGHGGIIGYVGTQDVYPKLLHGLKRLEYLGYDSVGLAITEAGSISTRKQIGRVSDLEASVKREPLVGVAGIGHLRLSAHGTPTEGGIQPVLSHNGSVAIALNGTIENAAALRRSLENKGYIFSTHTDTEVLANLIEHFYGAVFVGEFEKAIEAALDSITGNYAIVALSRRDPERIVVARLGSPLLIGVGDSGETFVASDAAALIAHTRDVIYLDDGDMATITKAGYTVQHRGHGLVNRPIRRVDWDLGEVERGGYPHFMLKEIMEQPETLRATMYGRLRVEEGVVRLGGLQGLEEDLRQASRVVILGCGTSWHSGRIGEYMLEDIARISTEVEYASEFRYRQPVVEPGTLVLAISQSGETADTLWAMREAKRQGATALGIVNVVGSTIARETDAGVFLHAGPEVGVASTKAFTSQLVVLAMMTVHLGRLRGTLSASRGREIVRALQQLPEQVAELLEQDAAIKKLAEEYKDNGNFLYLGRGYNFPAALEGALKLKEISYIHAEGYPAAEMKHGPIALIDENMPVVVIAPRDAVYDKVRSNIDEVKARGGCIIAVISNDDDELEEVVNHVIRIPRTHDALTPILASVPLQLLAYHIAVLRGVNVDQPRSLTTRVAVE